MEFCDDTFEQACDILKKNILMSDEQYSSALYLAGIDEVLYASEISMALDWSVQAIPYGEHPFVLKDKQGKEVEVVICSIMLNLIDKQDVSLNCIFPSTLMIEHGSKFKGVVFESPQDIADKLQEML